MALSRTVSSDSAGSFQSVASTQSHLLAYEVAEGVGPLWEGAQVLGDLVAEAAEGVQLAGGAQLGSVEGVQLAQVRHRVFSRGGVDSIEIVIVGTWRVYRVYGRIVWEYRWPRR